ncbi:unnamed protein product, partial [Notodromas monacha]
FFEIVGITGSNAISRAAAGVLYTLVYFAGSQLQPTSARALFPCFDEPGLKATFSITVGHPNKYHAYTNMPLTKSAVDSVSPNIIWDYHETSVVMSTYLVAIIVGDFTRVPTSDPRQFILVRDEVTNLTRDAAVFVPTILNEMETRLSTPFPLPKLDHAGVFGFNGGMENYGLIFYAETDVAGIDGSASLTLMAHETSHMWTGNLVTCQWWDVAWLNEGMTHFFTYLISEKVDPSSPYLDFLGTQLMDNGMDFDLEPTAPPMVVPISQPADIVTGFAEELIYIRGGNIGRVMYLLLGDEIFMEGMKNYFADNQFQSVREEHLFTALNNAAEAAGLGLKYSVSELITPFSNQAGFPLVTVTNTGAKVDGKSVYSVSQRRLLNVKNNEHDDDTLWPIALTWATSSNPNFDDKNPKTYLTEASTTVTIDGDDDWVLFNNRRSGYYRVNYDTVTWNKILDALKTSRGTFPNTNVAAIISDGLRLCLLGLVDPDVCERIPKNLMDERSLIVWLTAAKNLHKAIARVADKTAELSRIKEIVKNAEFNALKTREAMTPERESVLELLRNFSKHLEEPNATRAFISSHEEFWNKLFEKQKQNLKKRLSSRKYPHQKLQN